MRLIDADELKHRMETVEMFGLKGLMKVAREMVTASPTVDAVEVVRCKDCEFRNGCDSGKGDVCDYSAVYVHPNGFCNWGKRREE